jgi:hypothetical protein
MALDDLRLRNLYGANTDELLADDVFQEPPASAPLLQPIAA